MKPIHAVVVLTLSVGVVACGPPRSANELSPNPLRYSLAQENAPRNAVMSALKTAYEQLGIPVKIWDPKGGTVGNSAFVRNATLNGVPLSNYISCPYIFSAMNAADRVRVTFSLISRVSDNGAFSSISTHLLALAEAVGADETAAVHGDCSENGVLGDSLHALAHRILIRASSQ